jgi:hypothetical protein
LLVLILFGLYALGGGLTAKPEPAPPPAPDLAPELVAKCAAAIEQAARIGLVRERPAPNRINVDEVLWAQLPASTKDQTMQFVACARWRKAMPPPGEYVVAYGWRSGRRLWMLTEAGMLRE